MATTLIFFGVFAACAASIAFSVIGIRRLRHERYQPPHVVTVDHVEPAEMAGV